VPTIKGSHMLRFCLAGLLSIGGVILLFVGSLGDPVMTVRELPSAFAASEPAVTQEAAPPFPSLSEVEQATPVTPADVNAGAVAGNGGGEADATEPQVTTANVPPASLVVAPPVYHGPVSYAPPWQTSVAPVRRVLLRSPGTPAIITAFRRELRALFRPPPRTGLSHQSPTVWAAAQSGHQ
jgi:hypothetical protein